VSLGGRGLASLDSFFRAVGSATRDAVVREYPSALSEAKVVQMIATSPAHAAQAAGAHAGQLEAGLIAPVRHLVDAGGKSWRSYGILAACDAVGGAAHAHWDLLALAELLHVGSLIVDDLQDDSALRRGRPAVHLAFSPAVAINAGTAAYFYCERIIMRGAGARAPADTLRLLENYFGCMRAGHAGQALDIAGLDYLMAEAIAAGAGAGGAALAESRLLAVHMLKTGVPAASLLRMGCVLGGGSDAQVMALGNYYEAVGCAFQIMDDVRNLRGVFSGSADKAGAGVELKTLGEDISAGKVTFPLVKALALLPREEMAALWETVRSKPTERSVVEGVIAKLEACGALDACVAHATRLVEEGYAKVDGAVEDSLWKCFLRAFGSYLVELPK
jgi:geranylgeranyl pyrophosphate synthase